MSRRGNQRNQSFGVFTSSSAASFLSKDDQLRLFYKPHNETEYYAKRLTPDERGENMHHVHNAGKTYGEHLPWRRNRAPLLERESSCKYNRDYNRKVGIGEQAQVNRDLALSFQPARQMKAPRVDFGYGTAYSDIFVSHSPDVMKASKPLLAVPDNGNGTNRTVSTGRHHTVRESHEQQMYSGKNMPFCKGEAHVHVPVFSLGGGTHGGDVMRTTYGREIGGSADRPRKHSRFGSSRRSMSATH
mmetsp:Transcript_49330/g.89176  ORF Transcript_49330/g.89176 Transcript_49330/m.89176 type:complete len:244 (+) Transcript_49330:115-846(+)